MSAVIEVKNLVKTYGAGDNQTVHAAFHLRNVRRDFYDNNLRPAVNYEALP